MKKYKIRIKDRNKLIEINGKVVRTPIEFVTIETKLNFFKTKFRTEGITNYSIEEFVKVVKKESNTKMIKNVVKENKKVQLKSKPKRKTTLNSFLDE